MNMQQFERMTNDQLRAVINTPFEELRAQMTGEEFDAFFDYAEARLGAARPTRNENVRGSYIFTPTHRGPTGPRTLFVDHANYDAPVQKPGPTEEHWRAVREAIEKVTGRGRWSYRMAETLPDFTITWDDPGLGDSKAGCLATFASGRVVIALRSDVPPEQTHRTMLHELRHAADFAAGLGQMPPAWLEEHARLFAEQLARM